MKSEKRTHISMSLNLFIVTVVSGCEYRDGSQGRDKRPGALPGHRTRNRFIQTSIFVCSPQRIQIKKDDLAESP